MKAHQKPIGKSDEWLTPRWILDALGDFDLDPCAPINRPWNTASRHYTKLDNGLVKDWVGRVWCNPPFNRYQRSAWMRQMTEHNNGVMLIPAALETKAFASYVWGKSAGILVLDRRPHFCYADGTEAPCNSGCPIVLIAYGASNFETLQQSGLGFALVEA